ncbi:ABC transporter permease [Paraburkholderia xenovorans]|jgi:NitT/TauT family transport system permease protein
MTSIHNPPDRGLRKVVPPRPAVAGSPTISLRRLLARPGGAFIGRSAVVLALIGVWALVAGLLQSSWVSSPMETAKTLNGWVADGSLWFHLQVTLAAMIAGFAIGSVAGIACGITLGFLPFVERVFSPFIVALYSLPKIAIAPLLVIAFGIGIESKIVLVAITVFFMMMFSALDGVREIDSDLIQTLRLMGASQSEIARKIILPGALTWIFVGLRLSVRLAFTAAILGEIISSNRGIGYLIEFSAVKYDSAGVFAAIIVVVACSVILTAIVTRVEKTTSRWRLSNAVEVPDGAL